MSVIEDTTPEVWTNKNPEIQSSQIILVRCGTGAQRICSICSESLYTGQEASNTPAGLVHWDCLGVEGGLTGCTTCFMILSNCECDR